MTDAAQPVRTIARNTVVDTVTDRLRGEILSGSLAPGARLPPERELAEQFGINRLTLRAALSRLEGLGLIQTQHGSGSVVKNFREHGGIEMLPDLVQLVRRGDPATFATVFRDVLDLRRTLAAETVALAAERHTDDDLRAIRPAMAAQSDRVEDVLSFARGDLAIARLIVRAARNLGLELLLNTIVRFPEEDPVILRAMYPSPRAQNQHYAVVLGLIESRDATLARDVMRTALEAIDRATLQRLQRQPFERPAR